MGVSNTIQHPRRPNHDGLRISMPRRWLRLRSSELSAIGDGSGKRPPCESAGVSEIVRRG